MNMNQLINMELEYVKLFSQYEEDDEKIVFVDQNILDMYSHNFTYYKNKEGLLDYIVKNTTDKKKGFFKIETSFRIEEGLIEQLSIQPEVTIYDFYHIKTANYKNIRENSDCLIMKANEGRTLEDGIDVDIKINQEEMGLDFATRRINRKALEYKDVEKKIDFYVCYHHDIPIGKIEYIHSKDIVKLEDFDILNQYQRKGFGSSMLKNLVKKAYNQNIEDVYLITDQSDTAKEMYQKCGFNKVGEKTELLFHFKKCEIEFL